MLVRKKQISDGLEVDLTPTRHRKHMWICFGFLENGKYFSILLDELLALVCLILNCLLQGSEDPVAVGVTAETCMVWVHVGARVDLCELLLGQLQVLVWVHYVVHLLREGLSAIRHRCLPLDLAIDTLVGNLVGIIKESLAISKQSV